MKSHQYQRTCALICTQEEATTEYLSISRTREKKREKTFLGLPLLQQEYTSTLLLPQPTFLALEGQVAKHLYKQEDNSPYFLDSLDNKGDKLKLLLFENCHI